MCRHTYKVKRNPASTGRVYWNVYVKYWFWPFWFWLTLYETLADAERDIQIRKEPARYY